MVTESSRHFSAGSLTHLRRGLWRRSRLLLTTSGVKSGLPTCAFTSFEIFSSARLRVLRSGSERQFRSRCVQISTITITRAAHWRRGARIFVVQPKSAGSVKFNLENYFEPTPGGCGSERKLKLKLKMFVFVHSRDRGREGERQRRESTGRYLFLAPQWDENRAKFGCRYIVTKGPEAHGCAIGTFSTPDHLD